MNAYLKIALVIIVLATIGLCTVGHYGVSLDEPLEIASVKYSLELITKDEPLPHCLRYYGVLFIIFPENQRPLAWAMVRKNGLQIFLMIEASPISDRMQKPWKTWSIKPAPTKYWITKELLLFQKRPGAPYFPQYQGLFFRPFYANICRTLSTVKQYDSVFIRVVIFWGIFAGLYVF